MLTKEPKQITNGFFTRSFAEYGLSGPTNLLAKGTVMAYPHPTWFLFGIRHAKTHGFGTSQCSRAASSRLD